MNPRYGVFYQEVLDLNLVMDLGWVKTFSADSESKQHISIVAPDASGLPIPDVSIEVEDVDLVYQKVMSAGHEIIYGIVDEQWGVRRFFVRGTGGKDIKYHGPHRRWLAD